MTVKKVETQCEGWNFKFCASDSVRDIKMKYVLVTGGVVSGLGKGVTASSIGVLLKNCGFRVTSIKIGEFHLHKRMKSL